MNYPNFERVSGDLYQEGQRADGKSMYDSEPEGLDFRTPGAEDLDAVMDRLAQVSAWVDEHNADASSTEQVLGRGVKIGEEIAELKREGVDVNELGDQFGRLIESMIAFTGQNPRKPTYPTPDRMIKEALDVATSALGFVEHITGNHGETWPLLFDHIAKVHQRAGLA